MACGAAAAAGAAPGVAVDRVGDRAAGRRLDRAGRRRRDFGGALVAAAVIAVLNAILPPFVAALRLPFTVARSASCSCSSLDALMLLAADGITPRRPARSTTSAARCSSRWSRRRSASCSRSSPATNDDDAYTLRVDPAHRAAQRRTGRRPTRRDHLPRDRRPRAAGAAPGDARRQRAEHGALAGRGRLHARRVGDRPLVPDRRQPGRDPARLERGHPRVPLGREGDRHG